MSHQRIECDHPITEREITTFQTAVPPSHPGYRETRTERCRKCNTIVKEST